LSCRAWVQAPQLARSADVVGEVFHPDLGFGPEQSDGPHKRAAHVVRLRTEHVLDPDADRGFGLVALQCLFGKGFASIALAVDAAGQPPGLERLLDVSRPIGRIRPDPGGGITAHQQLVHHLTVMYGSVGDVITPDQLVLAVDIDVVLVTVVAFAVFLGPACINVLL
jgi:hypothetical protein